jgi:hypothetical protein
MTEPLSQQLADWNAYFAVAGGAAATLLGLLFVAASLRLDIFRRREVEDVRLFAGFTLGAFLFAIAIAGLALAPHEQHDRLAVTLFLFGASGLLIIARIVRVWRRLNQSATGAHLAYGPAIWQDWLFVGAMGVVQLGLIAVALLLRAEHPEALGLLALVEAALLGLGTLAAWLLLSHARPDPTA